MQKQYIIDAFTNQIFGGNPAAVCVMEAFPEDELMQSIALENGLSETAFAVKDGENYRLRWFTPGGEIDLCGHATLGTAYVITRFIEPELSAVRFETMSGYLTVEREGALLSMCFPKYDLRQIDVTDDMTEALGVRPVEAYLDRDLLCILESEEQIRSLKPNQEKLLKLPGLLHCVSAQGVSYDSVSRVFAPKCGVLEDPVTGSAHCMIAPYWAKRLQKNELRAYQASARGGELLLSVKEDSIILRGRAAHYATAELFL